MLIHPERVRRREFWEWADGRPGLLTPGEVATLYRVCVATVGRWAQTGKLHVVYTPGNTRRFYAAEVIADIEPDNAEAVEAWQQIKKRLDNTARQHVSQVAA